MVAVALSLSTWLIGSNSLTTSPSLTCHSLMVTSLIPSPYVSGNMYLSTSWPARRFAVTEIWSRFDSSVGLTESWISPASPWCNLSNQLPQGERGFVFVYDSRILHNVQLFFLYKKTSEWSNQLQWNTIFSLDLSLWTMTIRKRGMTMRHQYSWDRTTARLETGGQPASLGIDWIAVLVRMLSSCLFAYKCMIAFVPGRKNISCTNTVWAMRISAGVWPSV